MDLIEKVTIEEAEEAAALLYPNEMSGFSPDAPVSVACPYAPRMGMIEVLLVLEWSSEGT